MSTSDWAPSGSVLISPESSAKLYQQRFLDDIAAGKPVNERMALALLCELVLTHCEVNPAFQKLVNVVMTKALIHDKLPSKKMGRPKGTEHSHEQIAADYYDGVDRGEDPDVVLNHLADEYEMSAEYIEKSVIENAKPWIPSSKPARDQARREAERFGLTWDFRNSAWAEAMKSLVVAEDTFAGLKLPAAKQAVDELLSQAAVEVKGNKYV